MVLQATDQSVGALQSLTSSINNANPFGELYARASFVAAPASWIAVVGVWVWRGRMRTKWQEVGFDREVFKLFMKMKGGGTRVQVLKNLRSPKDRAQIAQELGLDWRTIDDHVKRLQNHGFIRAKSAYGNVKIYELTAMGNALLGLIDDMEGAHTREDSPTNQTATSESVG